MEDQVSSVSQMEDDFKIKASCFPPDVSPKVLQEFYKKWSNTYDQDLHPDSNWPCVVNVTKTFSNIVGKPDTDDFKIIDLGAGTGLVAVELKKYGFTNVDALDASQHMLDKAKEKNLYKQYICEAVTAEKRLDIPTGTYDALISCGTITGGYVNSNAFDEVLRLVKQGGHICFTIRKNIYAENVNGYAEKFKELVECGKWQEVCKDSSDYYKNGLEIQKECFIFCFKVLKNE